jgi:hypothetical protein
MIAENGGIFGGTGRVFDFKYCYISNRYVTFVGSLRLRHLPSCPGPET